MDTLRGDHLSCVGHPRGLTPNLDRIAAEGSLFTAAFASDIPTQPSHTAIFTGRFGINSDIVSHYHPASMLDESVSWLPTIFQQKGYATCAVDHLFSMKGWFVRGYTDYMSPPGRSRAPASVINEIAFPWLEKNKEEDFFLFLHFWDPHIPYVPPSPFKEKYTSQSASWIDPLLMQRLRSRPTYPLFKRNHYDHLDAKPNLDYIADLYDAEVAYLDYEINRLFERLGDLGLLDDTMVVLFGDHGENMTEHDAWFDHAGLYDSVVHVPLIMWGPGLVPRARVDSLVQLVDVKPTVLDLVGLPPVDGMDGRSLLPVMKGEATTHRDVVYLSECTWQAKRGIRTEDWKFIRSTDPGVYPRVEDELYDLRNDPEEQKNVALEYPDIAADMGERLSTWVGVQLDGRPDPMNQVVADGLPAVVRLDGVINEAEREAHQIPDQSTAEHPVVAPPVAPVAAGGAMVATGTLPTAAIMTPSSPGAVVATTLPADRRHLNRRRALFVAVVALLAVLALIFTINDVLGGNLTAAGVLQPKQSVDLNFSSTAPIETVWVQPGESVHKGEILATQDTTALESKLAADEAKLNADNTMMADGPTPNQTPAQLSSKVAEAQAALSAAQTRASSQASLDGLAVTNANTAVISAQSTLGNDQAAATSACSAGPNFSTTACDAATHQDSEDQAALTAAQGAYQQALQTQSADQTNSQSAIAEAQAALTSAQADQTAGTQPQDATQLSSEQAAVNQDQANVTADKKNIALAQVVAPFNGTVANVNGDVGDLAGPNGVQQQAAQGGVTQPSSGITLFPSAPTTQTTRTPQQESLITLASRQMTVVVQVPEANIGQVSVGQAAQVTFPAQTGTTYDARVTTINPTAVNQSGSVYFLVELHLVSEKGYPLPGPSKLKGLSGLSANVTFN
jgi:arylsulfatase